MEKLIEQKNLEAETEKEVDEDERDPYISHSDVVKVIKEMTDKTVTTGNGVPEDNLEIITQQIKEI